MEKKTIAALAVGLAALIAPSSSRAQQCVDSSVCPVGTACVGGVCVQQAAQPPPGYGGSVTVQAGAQPGTAQVQVQAAPAQQPVYAQPQYAQPQYAQPQYAQPPPQPRTETGHLTGLIVSGAVVFGVSWLTNILIGLGAGAGPSYDAWDDFRWVGLVPVLGPWIQMGIKPTSLGADDWAYYLTIDGILQAAGATMLILGIAIPVERTVYAEDGERRGIDLAIAPSPTGLNLLGRF